MKEWEAKERRENKSYFKRYRVVSIATSLGAFIRWFSRVAIIEIATNGKEWMKSLTVLIW